jgi:galactose mutarotase-like enzyme
MESIVLTDGAASAEVLPARGALVARFDVGETRVLYLDPATVADPTKNVRGGIPFLFPTAGRLQGDRYQGREMKQHGFARNLPFTVERRDPRSLTLALRSSEETLARFPFAFRVELTFSLTGAELRIAQRYQNRGSEPMPLHVGFHPYFFVPDADKARARIATDATRAFDNVEKRDVSFAGPDFSRPEVDLHLIDHHGSHSALRLPGATIEIAASAELSHWVIWALAAKDFICLEPWSAPANALNSGERLLWVEPGAERALWLAIRVSNTP